MNTFSTDFVGPDTVAGAAGTTTGAGRGIVDVLGGIAHIANNQLSVVSNGMGATRYTNLLLLPGNASLNQEVRAVIDGASAADAFILHVRKQGSTAADPSILVIFNPDGTAQIFDPSTRLGAASFGNTPLTAGQNLEISLRASGASPTTVTFKSKNLVTLAETTVTRETSLAEVQGAGITAIAAGSTSEARFVSVAYSDMDTNHVRTDETINTQPVRFYVPNTYDASKPATLVIGVHGAFNDETFWDNDDLNDTRDALCAQNYILCASRARGSAWGAQIALDDYHALCERALAKYPNISQTFGYGVSMGGLTLALLHSQKRVPFRGLLFSEAAFDLRAMYDSNATFAGQMQSFYGVALDGSDFTAKTAGHNPMRLSPLDFVGVPTLFVASYGDTTVSRAANTDAFQARVAPLAAESSIITASGDHGDASHFAPADAVAFFARASSIAAPVLDGLQLRILGNVVAQMVREEMDKNSTRLASIKARTDTLPAKPASENSVTALSLTVGAISSLSADEAQNAAALALTEYDAAKRSDLTVAVDPPAIEVPAGQVAVFFRPTEFGFLRDTKAFVHYVNASVPHATELVRRTVQFKRDAASDAYAHVVLPVSEQVLWTECPDAALNIDTGRFVVLPLANGRDYWFEDELRAIYANKAKPK